MTLYELLSFNRNIVSALRAAGVKEDDYLHLDFYAEFLQLQARGEKVTYIVALLADKYGMSERKAYSLIRRYRTHCSNCAVLFEPVLCYS